MKRIFITGTAGFIGFHLAQVLLREGNFVHGFDGMTNFYDVTLKQASPCYLAPARTLPRHGSDARR